MIHDKLAQFCDATTATVNAAASSLIGSQYDLEVVNGNTAAGEPIWLVVIVTTAVQAAGAGTYTIKLMSDSTAAIDTSSGTTHIEKTFVTANNTTSNAVGKRMIVQALPHDTYEQFLGIVVSAATQNVTGGALDAFLTTSPQYWKAYANAI